MPTYVQPVHVADRDDCLFYHSMSLPDGDVAGMWDLRGREHSYLGGVDLDGKRVVEIGPASGHLTFWMEQRGAEVTVVDLPISAAAWDLVPVVDPTVKGSERVDSLQRVRNSFWYAYERLGSRARFLESAVYDLGAEAGAFDIAVLGSVLLHVRDPFLALQRVAALTLEEIVVVERAARVQRLRPRLRVPLPRLLWPVVEGSIEPSMRFLPSVGSSTPGSATTWWELRPSVVRRMLEVLGFGSTSVTFHDALYRGKKVSLYTVRGRRRRGQDADDRLG